MWLTNNILREILYSNNTVCCLCLKITGEVGEDALHTYDEVTLKDPDITIKLSSIITLVFENKILETEFVSHTVCEECAKSAISAFKFVDKCTDINKKVTSVLNNLKNCLDKTDIQNLVKARGIYVATDTKSFQSKAYCDRKKTVSSKSILLKRFKAFLRTEKSDKENVLHSFSHKILCDLCGVKFSHSYSLNNHKKFGCKDTKTYNDKNYDFDSDQGELVNTDESNDFDSERSEIKRQRKKMYFDKLERVSCEHCGIIFRSKYSLKKHIQRNCKFFKAEIISDDASGQCEIKRQQRKLYFDNLERVPCEHCGIICRNKYTLKKHIQRNCKVIKGEILSDDLSDQSEIKRQKLKLYFENLERISCEHCGIIFRNKYRLMKHMQRSCKVIKAKIVSDNATSYQNILDLEKKTPQYLKSYSQDKTKYSNKEINPQFECVICDYCDKSFQNKSALKVHIYQFCKAAPSYQDRTCLCRFCGKEVSKRSMKTHESIHTSHFECSKCGKVFKTSKGYKKHLLIPKCNEKPVEYIPPVKKYGCHICGKLFANKLNIKGHIQARHSDSGFECKLCQKKLSSQHSLKLHMVVHTKQKDFECETCGGKFVSKASLLYHTRTHTGEKPYKCKYCDNWFLSASRRNMHIRMHHLPPQLECKFCMKLFKAWGALNRHRRRHFNPSSSLYMGNVDSQV